MPTCTCRLGWGRSQERNNGAYQPFCPERAAPPALTVKPDNSVPSHTLLVVFKLLSICWNFWCLYESKSVLGLFQRMPGSTAVLSHLSGIPADFHSQKLWGFLFLALVLWPEEPVWDWDPSLFKGTSTAEISPWILTPTHECGTNLFHIFIPPTSFDMASSLFPKLQEFCSASVLVVLNGSYSTI